MRAHARTLFHRRIEPMSGLTFLLLSLVAAVAVGLAGGAVGDIGDWWRVHHR
jgi:hypothetical protein